MKKNARPLVWAMHGHPRYITAEQRVITTSFAVCVSSTGNPACAARRYVLDVAIRGDVGRVVCLDLVQTLSPFKKAPLNQANESKM
jgi:hypothetical protein